MNKAEALNNARSLVQEAVEIANRAGIDPADVVAPHCAETAPPQDDRDGPGPENLKWCGVSVIIDNDISELFGMSQPDDDPEQKPAFLVTQSTATLVRQDFEKYEPSLERMAEDWQERKKPLLIQKTSDSK
ncbi:MAG: hypothetical protein ABI923_09165 [bacterium]